MQQNSSPVPEPEFETALQHMQYLWNHGNAEEQQDMLDFWAEILRASSVSHQAHS